MVTNICDNITNFKLHKMCSNEQKNNQNYSKCKKEITKQNVKLQILLENNITYMKKSV